MNLGFLWQYVKLRFRVFTGLHQTDKPLDLKWRRKYWYGGSNQTDRYFRAF